MANDRNTKCENCNHVRTSHASTGCIHQEKRDGKWWNCPCTKRYMDFAKGYKG